MEPSRPLDDSDDVASADPLSEVNTPRSRHYQRRREKKTVSPQQRKQKKLVSEHIDYAAINRANRLKYNEFMSDSEPEFEEAKSDDGKDDEKSSSDDNHASVAKMPDVDKVNESESESLAASKAGHGVDVGAEMNTHVTGEKKKSKDNNYLTFGDKTASGVS